MLHIVQYPELAACLGQACVRLGSMQVHRVAYCELQPAPSCEENAQRMKRLNLPPHTSLTQQLREAARAQSPQLAALMPEQAAVSALVAAAPLGSPFSRGRHVVIRCVPCTIRIARGRVSPVWL